MDITYHQWKKQGPNRVEAKKALLAEDFSRTPISLYRYVRISDAEAMRERLFQGWRDLGVLGRVYLATEGINAQVSVPDHHIDDFRLFMDSFSEFKDVPFKVGVENGEAFTTLQIKIKKQIVADGLTQDDYDIENVGNHLTAHEWNEAMANDDTIVVDMRNHYESEIGHFDGAVCPEADTFRDELPLVADTLKGNEDKKVLLYCTGGIRCEKASAYLKHQGFKDVNQLHGGIINYKHQVEREGLANRFLGANYVFDGRGRERIGCDVISTCHQCGDPCDRHVNCKNTVCNLLFLQCDNCEQKTNRSCSKACKRITSLPEAQQKDYYRKHGTSSQEGFSKSLRGRERMKKRSPFQNLLNLFQK